MAPYSMLIGSMGGDNYLRSDWLPAERCAKLFGGDPLAPFDTVDDCPDSPETEEYNGISVGRL